MEGFPGGSVVKNPPAIAGDVGSVPGSRGSPGEGDGNPLQYSCLGNPMDRGAGRLQSTGSQRVRHDWATNQQQHSGGTDTKSPSPPSECDHCFSVSFMNLIIASWHQAVCPVTRSFIHGGEGYRFRKHRGGVGRDWPLCSAPPWLLHRASSPAVHWQHGWPSSTQSFRGGSVPTWPPRTSEHSLGMFRRELWSLAKTTFFLWASSSARIKWGELRTRKPLHSEHSKGDFWHDYLFVNVQSKNLCLPGAVCLKSSEYGTISVLSLEAIFPSIMNYSLTWLWLGRSVSWHRILFNRAWET